jgi:hypothetical protein
MDEINLVHTFGAPVVDWKGFEIAWVEIVGRINL